MDAAEIKFNTQVKDIPPIPIKTYQWEDLKRTKKKRAYPYTHLFKVPYDQEVDSEQFTMEAFRRSKSASTLEKTGSDVVIREITEETKSAHKDYLDVGGMSTSEGIVESAESFAEDNISQYLDAGNDDRPDITEQIEVPGSSPKQEYIEKMETNEAENEKLEKGKIDAKKEKPDTGKSEGRAKSEEPKRKRKLSIESSYSRISLSRLGLMKKFREAKEKIKLPKMNYSKSDSKLHTPKKHKKGSRKEKETTDTNSGKIEHEKVEGPLYIHIPLKPPPGQTDEFSYLEFGDIKSDTSTNPAPPIASTDSKEEAESPVDNKSDVQFIILTAPSDDEILDDPVLVLDSPTSDKTKLKDLKSLARDVVDEISPDTKIIFEDVIQVEYVDENNRPLATTENSKIIEVTEENLPKIERTLSKRSLRSLQKEIRDSRESLNKLVRQREIEKLRETSKTTDEQEINITPLSGSSITLEDANKESGSLVQSENDKEIIPDHDMKAEKETDEPIVTQNSSKEEKGNSKINESKEDRQQQNVMVDEEDGLKLSEEAVKLLNEEMAKEKLLSVEEDTLQSSIKPTTSLKKKVSFKRKSKQEDPDGIYEDVQVTSDKSKEVEGKQSGKELKVLDTSVSMSVDEEKTNLDEQIVKTTSLEKENSKWSKLPDHEYEPVNPPDGDQQQTTPHVHATTAIVDRDPPTFSGRSIRIPLHEDIIVQSDGDSSADVLTAEEMQARIEDRFFAVPKQESSTKQATDSPVVTMNVTTDETREAQPEGQGKKIQAAFKNRAEKICSRLKNIKKPNITLPQRSTFKINTRKMSLPKIPDQVKFNLPSFTLPKKGTAKKRSLKERQFSTESNVGDSKKKIFDFSTYPRIFSKKKKRDDFDDDTSLKVSTMPKTKNLILGSRWGQKLANRKEIDETRTSKESETKKVKSPDVVRIPLHSEESMDRENSEEDTASPFRYNKDIEMDDADLDESEEIPRASSVNGDFSRNRWNHGSFHGETPLETDNDTKYTITDLDNESPPRTPSETQKLDIRSTSSSGDVHRRGVLEEINSDEFFLRQKGISQDDIEMGAYLSLEIREAFRRPVNALSQMQNDEDFDHDLDVSDHSLQDPPKRKPIKKPKRKKTPHVSQEQIPYDQESETEEYPKTYEIQPPKRKNKKNKKNDSTIPYQETIPIRHMEKPDEFNAGTKSASDNILNQHFEDDRHYYNRNFKPVHSQMYENEHMINIEQPNILISDPYQRQMFKYADDQDDLEYVGDQPEAPPRKHKSLKSLTSEHNSVTDEVKYANQSVPQQNVEAYRIEHEYIIPIPEDLPMKPLRTRSRTRSQSRTTQADDETKSSESQISEQPCIEEPCVQQLCDYMGYAIIDKTKQRDPPLPPPPRRKRSINSIKSSQSESKFFTVPRPLKDEAPIRPLRNYSTLVPKDRRSTTNITDEEKENISLSQYLENDDDEHSRSLQSGDVIQKMKDRPLPAPPRPPRKHKPVLKDVTYKENITEDETAKEIRLEESEVSVQTEPLPDDFVCEEFVQEKSDRIITPTLIKNWHPSANVVEHQETITHGALVVAPVSDTYRQGPLTTFSKSTERIIIVKKETDIQSKSDEDEESSEITDDFKKLKDPPPKILQNVIERPVAVQSDANTNSEVTKSLKLQVSDLDVDRLSVNELVANTIRVSNIDTENISVSEINPKSGNVLLSGVELPASLFQELLQKLQVASASSSAKSPSQFVPKESEAEPSEIEVTEKSFEITSTKPIKQVPSYSISHDTHLMAEIDQIVTDAVHQVEQSVLGENFISTEEDVFSDGPLGEENQIVGSDSAEDRLIEELKQVSDEQKKTSFEDEFDLGETPQRPPRHYFQRHGQPQEEIHYIPPDYLESSETTHKSEDLEETPPPRPPEPTDIPETIYFRSQPPPSFYALRSPVFHNIIEDIPLPPRRRRQQKTLSRSSSDEMLPTPRGRRHRTPEPSIPQLAGQLTSACATAGDKALRRLIKHITTCVLQNADGRQDLHVFVVILLVLIAWLILLGWGDGKSIHHHHWEYFNPPRAM